MSINVNDKNLGHATAYAYYKAGGGTMTEAEFTEFMADFGTASQTAVEAAQAALASKNAAQTAATTATNKASEATTAATTATNKAAEAQADADAAALDASQAMSAASTATSKATEATTAAATATSAKTDAVAANTAAQSAKTAAQTAQTGAETAAASVSASAAQIATNTEDIAQLKSELTAVDTEVTDIRVGADGTTYNSAGDAVRGQISDVNENLGHISEKGKNLFPIETKTTAPYGASVEYEDGVLTFSGTASGSNPDYSYSACTPVECPAGKYTFSRDTALGQTILRKVNDTSVTNVAVLQGTTNTTTFTLSETTVLYLYIGSLSGSITTTQMKIQLESGETKTDWEEPWVSAVDKIARNHETSVDLTWTSGKAFIYNAGWSNNSGWSYADIDLKQGQGIIVTIHVYPGVYPLSVWSEDGNSIIKVCFDLEAEEADKVYTYVCSAETEKVRLNVLSTYKNDVSVLKFSISDILNNSNIKSEQNNYRFTDVLYNKIIAIGDSLTQGSYTGYDLHTDKSYPSFLAKMMGCDVENAGRAGWTTLEWFDGDSENHKGFPYYDYSDYDTAVICLGTNGGFTDTVDDGATDTTNTGAYCSIIEGMRTQNPDINILLCNLWTSGGTGGAALANTVINKIATKYGLTVIDLQSEFRTVYGAYHAVQGNIHLGRIGYAKMAQIIRNALEKQVLIDPTNYNFIPS